MAEKKTITILLDEDHIKRLDKLSKLTDMNRSQLIRALVSNNDEKLALLFSAAKKIDSLF